MEQIRSSWLSPRRFGPFGDELISLAFGPPDPGQLDNGIPDHGRIGATVAMPYRMRTQGLKVGRGHVAHSDCFRFGGIVFHAYNVPDDSGRVKFFLCFFKFFLTVGWDVVSYR